MIIFTRNRSPWVPVVFICLIAVATFIKINSDSQREAKLIEADKQSFVPFKDAVKEKIGAENQLLNSDLLFEFYRCAIQSNKEKVYCNRKTDELVSQLTPEQQKELVPVFEQFFMKK